MTVNQLFSKIETLIVPDTDEPVYAALAVELEDRFGRAVQVAGAGMTPKPNALVVRLTDEKEPVSRLAESESGGAVLSASRLHLFYGTLCYLADYRGDQEVTDGGGSMEITAPFLWNRPSYDSLLTQLQRTTRGFDYRSQIRDYARCGFSHVEVNALSTGHGIEPGVRDEVYPVFYTYCPALDQFSSSKLNRGCYSEAYLAANMALMKRYANEARKYGMKPGMLCFEPRNVPDQLLERYPMLRGARVDHPFRSLKPRYSLALSHPYTRLHYKELLLNIMREIPEMDYLSITSNDSGAGFEFTRSLYVGSNGGPYLIREWKSVEEVAKTAAENAARFYELFRDVASEINPEFRVIMRLEPFGIERPHLLESMGGRIDIEGSSFEHTGYGFSYHHDLYEDVVSVQNTLWHNRFRQSEAGFINEREALDSHTHVFYTFDGFQNFDPLLAIPAPWMVAEKLKEMKRAGCRYVANMAGITPESLAPYDVNREMLRLFAHDPDLDVDSAIAAIAARWVSGSRVDDLVAVWRTVQESVRAFPPAGLYTSWGMAWYKLWIRPLVPDIDAIPEAERAYYERFLLATPHNPNRIDLNMDILFELGGRELAAKIADRIDATPVPVLAQARERLAGIMSKITPGEADEAVFSDLAERLAGLAAWYTTQRNTQAWIAGVHSWLKATDDETRTKWRSYLDAMMDSEIENCRALVELVRNAKHSFMAVSELGESVHMYGETMADKIERKISLMERYRDRDPRIDPKFIWRVPGIDFYDLDEMPPGATPVSGQLDDV